MGIKKALPWLHRDFVPLLPVLHKIFDNMELFEKLHFSDVNFLDQQDETLRLLVTDCYGKCPDKSQSERCRESSCEREYDLQILLEDALGCAVKLYVRSQIDELFLADYEKRAIPLLSRDAVPGLVKTAAVKTADLDLRLVRKPELEDEFHDKQRSLEEAKKRLLSSYADADAADAEHSRPQDDVPLASTSDPSASANPPAFAPRATSSFLRHPITIVSAIFVAFFLVRKLVTCL